MAKGAKNLRNKGTGEQELAVAFAPIFGASFWLIEDDPTLPMTSESGRQAPRPSKWPKGGSSTATAFCSNGSVIFCTTAADEVAVKSVQPCSGSVPACREFCQTHGDVEITTYLFVEIFPETLLPTLNSEVLDVCCAVCTHHWDFMSLFSKCHLTT